MNLTAEQLDEQVCASDGLYKALTSPIMKLNCLFIIFVILLSYYFSYKALRTLIHQNIFSECTRLILLVGSINSIAHQTTMMEIRIRQIYRGFVCEENRCQIQFHSSECVYELYFYYITNFFSTFSLFSLTFDRLIAHFWSNIYSSHQKLIPFSLLLLQLILAVSTHLYGFLGVSLAGYVPMCTFPPQLANNFDTINRFRTYIMLFCIGITVFILIFSMKAEKRIHNQVYDTNTRYMAYENVMTTKTVCLIIISQFLCIIISSYGITIIRNLQSAIPEDIFHTIVPFLPGVTYANLCLPIVICYKTKETIRRRKSTIGEMTAASGSVDTHMEWLTTRGLNDSFWE
ncbi:unnamed protein product [Caenorhabditis sp. 36 PRJEB53466]|nr:unnamed protein product [Caenorhabditis sp. 36 PRJEB53466]